MEQRFIHKPKFIPEYVGDDGLMKYSMDSDLIYWDGTNQIIVKAVSNNEVFITNLASIPTWLHKIIKPDNKYIKYASALHDGLYEHKSIMSRVRSDWMYLSALKAEECPLILRWTFFLGVRCFGSSYR